MKISAQGLAAGIFLFAGVILASGQDARQRQHELTREDISPERLAETPEEVLIEDDEFGEQLLLRRLPPPPLVTIYGDVSPGYTSNIFLDRRDTEGDMFVAGTAGVVVEPRFVRAWEPALSAQLFAQYQIFRYDDFGALDFDGQSIGLSAEYALPRDFTAYGGWTGSRLVDRDYDKFFEESQLTLGINTVLPQTNTVSLVAGYQGDLRHTSPGFLSRLDHGPYAGVQTLLHRDVLMSLRYRFAHQHYLQQSRDDLNSQFSLATRWRIFSNVSVRFQGTYAINNSNRSRNKYDLANVRLGATASYSF